MKRTSAHQQDSDRTIKTPRQAVGNQPTDDAGTSTRPSTSQIPQTSGVTSREEVGTQHADGAGTSTRPSTSQIPQTSGVTSREEVGTQPADDAGTSTRPSTSQIPQTSGVTSRKEVGTQPADDAGTSTRPSTSQIPQTSGVTSREEVGTQTADAPGTSTRPSTSQIPQTSGVTSREEVGTQTADDAGTSTRPSTSYAVGVSEDASSSEISLPTLSDVARKLGHDWKDLAIQLGFESADISTFEANDPGNVNYQKFQMLVAWRQRQPAIGSQMDVLCAALARINRNDIVTCLQGPTCGFAPRTDLTNIQQLVMDNNKDITIPAHPLDPSRTLDIDHFSELQLTQNLESNETTQETIHLAEGRRNLDKVKTKPLDSSEDMFEVLVRKLRILLSGGAGFGKSTLLMKVANASTDPKSVIAKKFKLVFPVKLRQMRKTSCVLEAIRNQILPNIDRTVLKKVIDDNEADTAFLLDGLDEIPSDVLNAPAPEGGYGVKDILHNKVLRRSTVLTSTRPHMVDFAIKEYPRYTRIQTLGFTFETAKKYITSYFAKKGAANKGKSLISHVTSSSLPRTLAQIPIIVLFLCVVWESLSKLPEKLTELYTKFVKSLVSRRCSDGEDEVELMKSVVLGLGRVALNGLLNPKRERLVFSAEEFDKEDLKDGCRLGFLQRECFTSDLELIQSVTFQHKSIQEYCAACYFANLYHTDEEEFHKKLKQINVRPMEYLLRFACGISSGSPATGLILEHVQLQNHTEILRFKVKNVQRLLLFESGCDNLADELDRPTDAECDSQEDLLAMRYYLQCLRQPLVELNRFTVHCGSHDDLTLLRDINDLLPDNTAIRPDFYITCRSHEDLTLLREMIRSGNIRPVTGWWYSKPCWVTYIMSEQANEDMQTLEETLKQMDERLRGQLRLALEINEMSHFDDECVLGSLTRVCNQIVKVELRNRTYDDVSRLGNALGVRCCDGLISVAVYDTNLHGHLRDVAPLVPPSLLWLTLRSCGLNDDDVPDLISILPHGLGWLGVSGNAFSVSRVETLTTRLRDLPSLMVFRLCSQGSDAEYFEQVVNYNLPTIQIV